MMVKCLYSIMGRSKEDSPEEGANSDFEYLAFELGEFYLQSLKKECIDKNITLNQMIVNLVGDAVKNWPDNPREEQKLRYKRVTAKVPKWISGKLNARKEETNIPVKGLVLLIVGLHYLDFDVMREIVLGDTLPPLPHVNDLTRKNNSE
jgi:hypothetical protein